MNRSLKIDWASILLLVPYLLTTMVPYFKLRIRFVWTLPFVVLWLVWNMVRNKKMFISKNFVYFAIFFASFLALRLAMYVIVDGQVEFYALFVTNCVALFPVFVLYCLYKNDKICEIKIIVVFILLCMAICAISSASLEAGMTRTLASQARDYEMEVDRLELMNQSVATYGSVYGMGLVVIAITYGWKMFPVKIRYFMTFILAIFVTGILKAAYSIAIVMTVAGLMFAMLAFIFKLRIRYFRWTCFFVCLMIVLITAFPQIMSFLSTPIRALAGQIETYEYRMRLESIADAFSGYKDAYAAARSALYWLSFDTFLHNPLIGKYINSCLFENANKFLVHDYIGGHSLFFDTLGQLGLLGFSILAMAVRAYRRFLHDLYVHAAIGKGEISCECAYYALLLAACLNPIIVPELMVAFAIVVPALPLFYKRPYLPCYAV